MGVFPFYFGFLIIRTPLCSQAKQVYLDLNILTIYECNSEEAHALKDAVLPRRPTRTTMAMAPLPKRGLLLHDTPSSLHLPIRIKTAIPKGIPAARTGTIPRRKESPCTDCPVSDIPRETRR